MTRTRAHSFPTRGYFDGGFLTAFCDGSVHFIVHSINEKVLRALISINGGEVIDHDSY